MSHVEYSVMRKEIFNQRDLIVGRATWCNDAEINKKYKNSHLNGRYTFIAVTRECRALKITLLFSHSMTSPKFTHNPQNPPALTHIRIYTPLA